MKLYNDSFGAGAGTCGTGLRNQQSASKPDQMFLVAKKAEGKRPQHYVTMIFVLQCKTEFRELETVQGQRHDSSYSTGISGYGPTSSECQCFRCWSWLVLQAHRPCVSLCTGLHHWSLDRTQQTRYKKSLAQFRNTALQQLGGLC